MDYGAVVSETATIGAGAIIFPGCFVSSEAVIAKNAAIVAGALIGQGCVIGDNSVISGHVNIGGGCTVGTESYVGMGSRVKQGNKIGSGAIVEMGSVVMDDIPDEMIALGSTRAGSRSSDSRVERRLPMDTRCAGVPIPRVAATSGWLKSHSSSPTIRSLES